MVKLKYSNEMVLSRFILISLVYVIPSTAARSSKYLLVRINDRDIAPNDEKGKNEIILKVT